MEPCIDSAESLTAACDDTWVRRTEFHRTHPSTNNRALELIADSDLQALPLLIYAHQQTAGRGRGENVWWANPGALTFSLLLDPAELGFPTERWGTLSLATAMAMGQTLLNLVPDADVAWKWPNDIFVDGRKICGILLEVPSSRPPRMVIGIGLNVNNSIDDAAANDQQLRDRAVSLSSLVGEDVDLPGVLRQFLGDFADVATALRKDGLLLTQMWQARDYLRGRTISLAMGDKSIRGQVVGVDATGAILIETAPDKVESFPGGVISSVA